MGPTWAKHLLGWTLLLLGGLMSLLLVGLVVGAIAFGLLAETGLRAKFLLAAFWAYIMGTAAVAGWRILRARPVKGGGPRGWMWIDLAGIAMLLLLWGLSPVFLGPGPLEESAAYVTLTWWVLFLLSLPALKRFQSFRGSPIRWWEWGAVQGLLTGVAAGLQVLFSGRGLGLGVVGGLVNGLIFFVLVGGTFLWWEKVGRAWHLQHGGRPRWPFS